MSGVVDLSFPHKLKYQLNKIMSDPIESILKFITFIILFIVSEAVIFVISMVVAIFLTPIVGIGVFILLSVLGVSEIISGLNEV